MIGKYGGHITPRNTSSSGPVLLLGAEDRDRTAAGRHRVEERQALDVVPVEVGEQHAGAVAVEPALLGEVLAVVAQPGAEVEDDGIVTVGVDLHARRVPAVAVELVAVARSRSAHPPEGDVCLLRHTSHITHQPPCPYPSAGGAPHAVAAVTRRPPSVTGCVRVR